MNYIVVCITPKSPSGAEPLIFRDREDAPRGLRRAEPSPSRIKLDNKDKVTEMFTDEGQAYAEAARLASLNPKMQYAVMGILKVFETAEPIIITKVINSDNELVLEAK